jgi:hypothetical protein
LLAAALVLAGLALNVLWPRMRARTTRFASESSTRRSS